MDSNFYFDSDSDHESNTSEDLIISILIPIYSDFDFDHEPSTPLNVMKYEAHHLVLTLIGLQILECINCNENSALVTLSNGFLVIFSTKQCSQIDIFSLESGPNRPSLANLFI